MNERDWGKKFREEADDLLFRELQFDETLKARVRERISAETDSEENSPEQTEQTLARPMRKSRIRKAYSMVLAASFLVVVAAAASFSGILSPDNGGLPATEEHQAEIMMVPGDGEPDEPDMTEGAMTGPAEGTLEGDPDGTALPGTFPETDETVIMQAPADTDEVEITEVRELENLQEGALMFGDELRVPTDVPEGFSIAHIYADTAGDAEQLIIQYISDDDRMFSYTQHRNARFQSTEVDEPVDLNGKIGYLRKDDMQLELHWTDETFAYQLTGALSSEEMIKAARSVSEWNQ